MSRIMFRFWLDDTKQDENELIEQVGELKKKRKFTDTIRQGIELITDLQKGSLKVLFDLFPYVKAEFLEYVQSVGTVEEKPVSNERQELDKYREELDEYRQELEAQHQVLEAERQRIEQEKAQATQKQNAHVQEQLDRIEKHLLSQGNVPIGSISSSNQEKPASSGVGLKALGSGGLGQMNVSQVSTPVFDDDDEEDLLVFKKADPSKSNANQNLINGMLALSESSSSSTTAKPSRIDTNT